MNQNKILQSEIDFAPSYQISGKAQCIPETKRKSTPFTEKTFDQKEFINAFTMLAPSLLTMAYYVHARNLDIFAKFVFLGCVVHMPFSVMFHTFLGLNSPDDAQAGLGLIFRRLDYSFIHVASIMLSFGLSRSFHFGFLSILINGWFIFKIWSFNVKKQGPHNPPVLGVGICVSMYVLSMLFYGYRSDFFFGSLFMSIAFLTYKFKLIGGAYSHAAMHVALALPQFFFLSHSASVNYW